MKTKLNLPPEVRFFHNNSRAEITCGLCGAKFCQDVGPAPYVESVGVICEACRDLYAENFEFWSHVEESNCEEWDAQKILASHLESALASGDVENLCDVLCEAEEIGFMLELSEKQRRARDGDMAEEDPVAFEEVVLGIAMELQQLLRISSTNQN